MTTPSRTPSPRADISSETERSLRHSLKDAAAYATMFGAGETYLSAFAVYLRATTPQIGLLVSLPTLLGSFMQLVSAWLGKRTGRRKAIILAGAGLQALTWLPLASLPLLFPQAALPLLIGAAVVYHCGGHLVTPQWASLMGDIVPARRRGRFFASRTQIVSLVTFVSLILGGLVLQTADELDMTHVGFVAIFGIAMLARMVSVYQLSKMHDPPGHVAALDFPMTWDAFRSLRDSNIVRFSVFFALMQFSVAIASPFFSVYMLRDLQFSYAEFMANTGTSVLTQFLTLSQWGRISDVFGNRRILSAAGLMLPAMPLLWLLSPSFWYLLAVQVLSGLAWAGFTLSTGNFLYDSTAPEKRAGYLAMHNIMASSGILCGALVGGYLATSLPASIGFFGGYWTPISSLLGVFAISAIARAAVLFVLLPKIREVRRVRHISFSDLIFRVTRVNALAGLVFDIVGTKPKAAATDPTGQPRDAPSRGDFTRDRE